MRYVTAREAATICGMSERTIRRMIASGKLKARKVAPNRFEIAEVDLPRKKRDPLGELRAQVEALERRVRTLEAQSVRVARSEPNLTEQGVTDLSTHSYATVSHYSALHVASSGGFRTHADGAAWLAEHGIAQNTVAGWKREMERAGIARDKRSYLGYAIERKRTAADAWRVPWELHTCSDVLCVCHELVAGSVEG